MKMASQAQMDRRLRFFIFGVSLAIMACILVSISEFHVAPYTSRPRIGFLLTGGRDEAGWNRGHYQSAMAAAEEYNIDLVVREHITVRPETCRNVIDAMAAQGIRCFILAGHFATPEMTAMMETYPNYVFCVADAGCEGANIAAYSLRFYEARYLTGILAGMRTRTGSVGYVAPFPSPEINAGINAFAMGAQSVNPGVRVRVAWTGGWDEPEREKAAVAKLWETEVDVLTYQQDGLSVAVAADQAGIDYIGYQDVIPGHRHYLTAIKTEWRGVYGELFRRFQIDELKGDSVLWPGLLHRTLGLFSFGNWVASEQEDEVEAAEFDVLHGRPVFSGAVFDQDGQQRCQEGETLRAAYVRKGMNWLLKGVETDGRG